MRILLDLQGCQSPGSKNRGIGRYSMALAKAIIRNKGSHEISILLSSLYPDEIAILRREFESMLAPENIMVFEVPCPVMEVSGENAWRTRVAELVREYAIAELHPDIVHLSSLFEGFGDNIVSSIGSFRQDIPTAVTLYDLIPLFDPDRYLPGERERAWYYRKIESLKQANLLLSISEASRIETHELLDMSPEKIVNISSAVDEIFKERDLSDQESDHILQRYNISGPFIMSASVVEPRKNIENLIEAYAMLPKSLREDYKLVLVGNVQEVHHAYLLEIAKKCGLCSTDLIFTGYVSDNDLISLYNLCYLFVFPSLHEGFGLPILEAMSCGAAVIGSNTSSIPEVIGRKGSLFDPKSPASIADLMESILRDPNLAANLRQHSIEQAVKFSWDESACRAIKAFESLHSESSSKRNAGIKETQNERYQSLLASISKQPGMYADLDLLSTASAISANQNTRKAERS